MHKFKYSTFRMDNHNDGHIRHILGKMKKKDIDEMVNRSGIPFDKSKEDLVSEILNHNFYTKCTVEYEEKELGPLDKMQSIYNWIVGSIKAYTQC